MATPWYRRKNKRYTTRNKSYKPYTPEYNDELEKRVKEKENEIRYKGIKVGEDDDKRSLLDRIVDALQVGQYTTLSGVKNLLDDDEETTFLGGVKEGLKSANPFGKNYTKGETEFSEILTQQGWEPETFGGKTAKFLTGLAGDIFLDPLTYVNPLSSLSKTVMGTGTKVGKETVEAISSKRVKDIVESLAKTETGKEVLGDVTEGSINALTKQLNRYRGISENTGDGLSIGFKHVPFAEKLGLADKNIEIISEEGLRKLGDKTIAPKVREVIRKLKDVPIIKHLRASDDLERLATSNPEAFIKTIKFREFSQGHSNALRKAQENLKNTVEELFSNVDEVKQREIVKLLETGLEDGKGVFSEVTEIVDILDTKAGKKLFENLKKKKKYLDDMIKKEQNKLADFKGDVEPLIDEINRLRGLQKQFDEIEVVLEETKKFKEVYNKLNDEYKKIKDVLDKNSKLKKEIDKINDKIADYYISKYENSVENLTTENTQIDVIDKVFEGLSPRQRKKLHRKLLDKHYQNLDKLGKISLRLDNASQFIKNLPEEEFKKLINSPKNVKVKFINDVFGDEVISPDVMDGVINDFLNTIYKYDRKAVENLLVNKGFMLDGRSKIIYNFLANKYGYKNFNDIKRKIDKLERTIVDLTHQAKSADGDALKYIQKQIDRLSKELFDLKTIRDKRNKELNFLKKLSKNQLSEYVNKGMDKDFEKLREIFTPNKRFKYIDDIEAGRTTKPDYAGMLDEKGGKRYVSKYKLPPKARDMRYGLAKRQFGRSWSELEPYEKESIDTFLATGNADGLDKIKPYARQLLKTAYGDDGIKHLQKMIDEKELNEDAKKILDIINKPGGKKLSKEEMRDILVQKRLDEKYGKIEKELFTEETNKIIEASDEIKKLIEEKNKLAENLIDEKEYLERLNSLDDLLNDKKSFIKYIKKNYDVNNFDEYVSKQKEVEKINKQLEDVTNKLQETVNKHLENIVVDTSDDGVKAVDITYNNNEIIKFVDKTTGEIKNIDNIKATKLKKLEKELEKTTRALSNQKEFEKYAIQIMGKERFEKARTVSKIVLDDLDIDEETKRLTKFMRDEFKRFAVNEKAHKYLDYAFDEGYVPHILNPDLQKKNVKTVFDLYGVNKKFNPYSLSRKTFTTPDGKKLKTIHEINDYFNGLLKKKNLFIDTIADIYYIRALKHNELMYDAKFSNVMLDMFGTDVKKFDDVLKGEKLVIPNNDLKFYLKDVLKQQKPVEVKEEIKKLFSDVIEGDSFLPLYELNKKQFDFLSKYIGEVNMYKIPELVFNDIVRVGKMQLNSDLDGFLRIYDRWLYLWKLNVTAVIPGFHARNAISNNFQNYLNLGAKAFNPKTQAQAIKALKQSDEVIQIMGNKYTYSQLYDMAKNFGVIDEGFFAKDLPLNFSSYSKPAKSSKLSKINPLNAEEFFLYDFGRDVGNKIENHARMTNFIANLKLGLSPEEASQNVNKFLFDYFDLTPFEHNVMKRIIPFYTWARKNIPLQLEQMLKQPQKYRNVFKTIREVEEITPPSKRKDKDYLNDFSRDWIQTPFEATNPEGRKEPIYWNPNLPYGDVNRIPTPTSDGVKNIVSQLSPFIKVPIELSTNRNMYFDSPISRGEGHMKTAPSYLPVDKISPRVHYILNQISSLRTLDGFFSKKGADKATHAINNLAGIQTYSYDYDKYKTWALRDRLKELNRLNN